MTKGSPREWISLWPWLPPKGLPRSPAAAEPPSLCLSPAWGSVFLLQSATGLGRRVPGQLRSGTGCDLPGAAAWGFGAGGRATPGCCVLREPEGAVVGTGAQPGCLHPQLEDCTLQVSPSGHYLDLDLSLLEQKDELEGFYEEVR